MGGFPHAFFKITRGRGRRPPSGKVEFPFAYTYTAADAEAGKVTFMLVASLNRWDYDDARPEDNELIAATTVRSGAKAAANVPVNARVG